MVIYKWEVRERVFDYIYFYKMQKENAQPVSVKNPQPNAYDDQCPNIQSLNLDERSHSIAETNDEGGEKKECGLFEGDFFKTKPIDKRVNRHQKPDVKKKHNYQRKVEMLQKKIDQLQKQIHSIRRNDQFCPQCRYNLSECCDRSIRQLIIPEDYYLPSDVAGTCERSTSKDSVEFQKINFMTPLMMSPEMEQKSWIFIGTMMIAMGSKIMDVDGTINVFKVLNESVDSIRRQVEKCEEKINMDFYLSKEQIGATQNPSEGMSFDPFFAKHDQHAAGGFQLQGVKLQSVEQYELFYDQKLKFSVKYEALITVMQYLRQHCNIS